MQHSRLHHVEARRWMAQRDAQVCREARLSIIDAFPKMGRAAFRVVCYALDPDRKTGQGHVAEYTRTAGLNHSTTVSRWWRFAKKADVAPALYTPKYLITRFTLVRAFALLSKDQVGIQSVANYLGYSSAQCFCRHVKIFTGQRPESFRDSKWQDALAAVVAHLEPIRDALTLLRDGRPSGAFRVNGALCERCTTCKGSGLVEVRGFAQVAEVRRA